LILFC